MYWIRFSLVVLIATVLNASSMLNAVALGGYNIRPDLLLVLLLFFSSSAKSFDAIITSFAIGFAADISTGIIGPYCLSFGLFGSLVSQLHGVVLMKRMIHQGLAIFVIGMCAGITAWGRYRHVRRHYGLGLERLKNSSTKPEHVRNSAGKVVLLGGGGSFYMGRFFGDVGLAGAAQVSHRQKNR